MTNKTDKTKTATDKANNAKKTKQDEAAAMDEGEGAGVPAMQAAVEAQQAKLAEQAQQEQQATADGANDTEHTEHNSTANMDEGEGADGPEVQATAEAQQAQHTAQPQPEQQGTTDGQQPEQQGAFQLDLTQEVREAREGAASLKPVEGGTLTRNELQKLMLHLEWDSIDYVWQRTEVIGYLKDKKTQMDWYGLIGMTTEQLQQATAEMPQDKNLLIVVEEQDLPLLCKLTKAIEEVKPAGLHVLLFRTNDEALFPAAPKVAGEVPWIVGNYHRINRPLHFEQDVSDKKRPEDGDGALGRPPRGRMPSWAVCMTSTAQQRTNALQPEYGTLRLGDPQTPLVKLEVRLPEPPPDMMAIQVAEAELGGLLGHLGRRGPRCHAMPGRVRGATKIIFHRLDDAAIEAVIGKWSQTPHFAVMSLGEYTGKELERCELVVEVYHRKQNKTKKAHSLWATVDKVLSETGLTYALQHTAYNKARFGIPKECLPQFWERCIPELLALGLLMKNERTQAYITAGDETDITDDGDTTDSNSSDSSAAGRGIAEFIVAYDVPPWIDPDGLIQALEPLAGEFTSATQMTWTPGSPTLAAWKLQGHGVGDLQQTLLQDAATGTQIGPMSWREYLRDKMMRSQRNAELAARNVPSQSTATPSRSYSRVVSGGASGSPPQGKGRGKGGRGRGKISLLGPQHGYY